MGAVHQPLADGEGVVRVVPDPLPRSEDDEEGEGPTPEAKPFLVVCWTLCGT